MRTALLGPNAECLLTLRKPLAHSRQYFSRIDAIRLKALGGTP